MLRFRNTSCKDCEKRHVGCHSDCPDHIKDREEYEQLKKQIEDAKSQDRLYKDYKNKLFSKAYYKQQMKKKR